MPHPKYNNGTRKVTASNNDFKMSLPRMSQTVIVPELDRKPALIHVILMSKMLQATLILVVFGMITPVIVYMITFSREMNNNELPDQIETGTCGQPNDHQLQCGNANLSMKYCHLRKCCYGEESGCYHNYPAQHQYKVITLVTNQSRIARPLQSMTPYGSTSIKKLVFNVMKVTRKQLRISVGQDIPDSIMNSDSETIDCDYEYKINNQKLSIEVKNGTDNSLFLSTARGPMFASQRNFEWTLNMGAEQFIGFGELIIDKRPFKKLFLVNDNDTSSPFLIAHNTTTQRFYGILISSLGPIEMEITKMDLVIIRTMSSSRIIVDLFVGPTLIDVTEQLRQSFGWEKFSLPYWGLGVHVCRNNNQPDILQSIDDFNSFLNATLENGIPFDSHCIEENLLDLSNKTIFNQNIIKSTIDLLHAYGKQFLITTGPHIESSSYNQVYQEARDQNILLKNQLTDQPYHGLLNNKSIAYIDWINGGHQLIDWFNTHWPNNLPYNGIYIRTDCLQDFTKSSKSLNPSIFHFIPDEMNTIIVNLIPSSVELSNKESVINYYNLISNRYLNLITSKLTLFENPLVFTSPQYLSSLNTNGGYQIPEIIDEFKATWIDLRSAVQTILSKSLIGQRVIGTTICDWNPLSNSATDDELIIRWYQFASMLPIFRVRTNQTPDKFSARTMNELIKILNRRYSLLAYIYTELMSSTQPFIRSMIHEQVFESDIQIEQFFIGNAILVGPILLPKSTTKLIYLPNDQHRYFEIWGGKPLTNERWINFPVVQSDLPLFIRSGYIVPLHNVQVPALTAESARLSPLILKIALNCTLTDCTAKGKFFFNEQIYWLFEADFDKVIVTVSDLTVCSRNANNATEFSTKIDYIDVFGIMHADHEMDNYFSNRIKLNFDMCLVDESGNIPPASNIFYFEDYKYV